MDKDELVQKQIEQLLNYFQNIVRLNKAEKQMVLDFFKPRLFRKRHYILQEGDICKQFNFVVEGCLRLYKIDEKGNKHILQFATENNWILDIGSFHTKKESELNIDALEDTLVLQISYENLIQLYTNAPKFNLIFRVLIENAHISLQKRLLQNISSNAQERYKEFLKQYSQLSNRLPNTQIAAYLGITPEFLSQIRAKAN
ncbi:MAG: Crp/Fnr family transcriptional regulator [Flavobacterium sp.]|uniref:Crp/Fnr family transcriptional regulator n=1 Tax=Flavobacterium sp. TaxID=239 RepID=UPI0022C39FBF|nr:Crp/Fnr family transcriptional regulator [Flavobacterium sp.]MCZ8196525.1 Crp/Fnr family transcriptional regulator [Flavobacterium sp.]